ncbi:MAG: bleomycin hydrolase [Flavobacteriales bacterium]
MFVEINFEPNFMKRILLSVAATFFLLTASAQVKEYGIMNEMMLDKTETKDQCRTGTCWSYSTVSFLESELIRMGKGQHDLSEMFNVRMTYPKKAEMYLRYQGKYQFGPGSLSHDVINAMRDYGVVPEAAYSGINYASEKHDHGEMDAVLEGMMKALVDKRNAVNGDAWKVAYNGVLDAYLGTAPNKFEYQGKSYTPASFRDEMGLSASDYVSLTSFTHHPMNAPFVLEVPDNFSQGSFYNVSLDELENAVVSALENGYTLAWDADVSERGFSFKNAMAIYPAEETPKDQYFKTVLPEPTVTAGMRQEGFDNYKTTDDHLMHLIGTAKDKNGVRYFIIKNSWGSGNETGGLQYISSAYFRMKTIAVLLHKAGLPKELQKQLQL